jgi:hypothetical protein
MQTVRTIVALAFLTVAAPAVADTAAPVKATSAPSFAALDAAHARLFSSARPAARSRVTTAARGVIAEFSANQQRLRSAPKLTKPYDLLAGARARVVDSGYLGLGAREGADLDALVYLVLMEAAKEADSDLKSLMASVRAIEKAKAALKEGPEAVGRAVATEKSDLRKSDADAILAAAKNGLDSLSEMGETQALRLQMAMDRLSKMMATLSNIEKSMQDTAKSLVDQMK